MLPEAAPGERRVAGKLLKIFNDWRDRGELANLANAEVKDGFLDVVHRGGQAVIDGVDQAQKARGQAWVAADDLGNLRGVTAFGIEEIAKRAVDGASGGRERASREAAGESAA